MNDSMAARAHSGFSMIEVLVSLAILLVGLLGLAGLMAQSQRSEMESYQRTQALVLLQDMADRINANRKAAICYPFTSATAASAAAPYLGTGSPLTVPPTFCPTSAIVAIYPSMPAATVTTSAATVAQDLNAWHSELLGAAEVLTPSNSNAGAMIGARGCVTYDPTQQLIDPVTLAPIPGSGVYTISVAWQGMFDSYAITAFPCGQNQYGPETRRRVVTLTLRVANLK